MGSDTRQRTQDAVDALRTALDGCDLALVADWETGIVLCNDTGASVPQDIIEQVARTARADLDAPWVGAITTGGGIVTTTRVTAEGSILGLKHPTGDEIIVCRHSGVADRKTLHRAADTVFDILSDTGEMSA